MSSMEMTQQASEPPIKAPDFGEPWYEQQPPHPISLDKGVYWMNPTQFNRAVVCVNATAGMADPAKEIAMLKQAGVANAQLHLEAVDAAAEIAKLRTQLQAQEEEAESQLKIYKQELEKLGRENAAMRDAIREAHTIIERYSESAISHSAMLMCPECLRIEAFDEEHKDTCSIGNAIAKLQPFIPKP